MCVKTIRSKGVVGSSERLTLDKESRSECLPFESWLMAQWGTKGVYYAIWEKGTLEKHEARAARIPVIELSKRQPNPTAQDTEHLLERQTRNAAARGRKMFTEDQQEVADGRAAKVERDMCRIVDGSRGSMDPFLGDTSPPLALHQFRYGQCGLTSQESGVPEMVAAPQFRSRISLAPGSMHCSRYRGCDCRPGD